MIDIIDPVLRSSPQSKRIKKKYSFKKFSTALLVILIIAGLYWMIYITENSLLDTKPNDTIDTSGNIKIDDIEGSIPPIQETY